jgi:preprotein translocase subunit SecF
MWLTYLTANPIVTVVLAIVAIIFIYFLFKLIIEFVNGAICSMTSQKSASSPPLYNTINGMFPSIKCKSNFTDLNKCSMCL